MIGPNAHYRSKKHSEHIPFNQKQIYLCSILNRKILVQMLFASVFFTSMLRAAPASPSGVRIDVYLDSTVEIFWDQADKSDAVSGYELSRNGTRMWLGAVTNYVDSDRTPGIGYNYTVVAVDESGVRSADSRAVSVSDSCSNTGGSCTSFSFAESRSSKTVGANGLVIIDEVTLPTYENGAAEVIWEKNDAIASYDTSRNDAFLRRKDRQGSFDTARSSSYGDQYKIVAIDVNGSQLGDVVIADRSAGRASRLEHARTEGAAKYDIYRNGHWIATTNDSRFHDAGLSQDAYYEYTIYKIEGDTSQLLGSAAIATRGPVR